MSTPVPDKPGPQGETGRIVTVSGSFPPMPCGVGDSANELVSALRNQGLDVTVVTDSKASAGDGISAKVKGWGLAHVKEIVRAVEEEQPEIVHIHYPAKGYGKGLGIVFLPMLLRARRRKFKIVLTLHEFRLSHQGRKLASFVLLDACDAVCMPCPLELEALMRRHASVREKVTAAIPVGAVGPRPEHFSEEERAEMRKATRKEWGLSDDEVALVHYGTPTRSKGIEVLFKAVKLLKQEGEKPSVFMVGDLRPTEDPFHKTVAGQPEGLGISDQVRWLGRVSEHQLPGVFCAADIGVFPFLDGFSFRRSSLIALLMWDVPIVTTEPDGNLSEIIGQEKVRFVARNDPRALADALLGMVANRKMLEMVKRADNPLRELFGWDRIAEQYAEVYRQVLSRRK